MNRVEHPNSSLLSAVYGCNTTPLEVAYGYSVIINPSLGMYYEIHTYEASIIGSVKINASLLLMMRENDTLEPPVRSNHIDPFFEQLAGNPHSQPR